jgi:hypothetical protein
MTRQSARDASRVQIHEQNRKGERWMPRPRTTKKDVAGCDKPRGVAKQTVIRGCPNGETHVQLCAHTAY